MYLKKISIVNFKNIESQTFDFQKKINCFVGNNGVGKTNVLDAIYYLSFAKSYFNTIALQNINHDASFFMIEGQKKILKRNDKVYEKFSEHVGQFPLVIISPADRDLVTEGSETRRKFIDGVISQQNKHYLNDLISYNKVLTQRNALLKYFAANRTFDSLNLSVYDEQLSEYGTRIYQVRKQFLEVFIPIFNQKHQVISGDSEQVNLLYKSQLHDFKMNDLLKKSLDKDKILQFTTAGIHKDDLSFDIGDHPIKKFGSQGQQKSYLIALKLAQFEFIKQKSAIIPILLLDDIFDKLDEIRVAQIIALVNKDEFGQIFITDTHPERTENIVKMSNNPYQIFKL
jgi:DNA replication and repair protein RecF